MPKILTRRKQAWANRHKPNILRGKPLAINAAVQARYYRALEKLIRRMTKETRHEIEKLFAAKHAQEYFAQDASISAQAKILTNALQKKFDRLFALGAERTAQSMVDDTAAASKASLHASLKELSGGLSLKTDILTGPLKEVLAASVAENVGLIKSIASKYLDGVQGAVMRSITTGNGLQDLVPYLQKHEGVTLRRARLIARDQTRKAYSSINRHRMEAIGVKKFEWLHSAGGQKPRKLHLRMSGNIYSIDDPPVIDLKTGERGFPGQLINCRCRMVPVISFDEGDNAEAA